MRIHREANEKLSSWRKAALQDLLNRDEKLDPEVSVERVASAAQILHEHQDNLYFKLTVVERQLVILILIAALIVTAWIVVAPIAAPLAASEIPLSSRNFMIAVVLFGIMGAALSGLLSTAQGTGNLRIPEQLLDARVTLARLAMGAMAAVAVTTFLISGLLSIGQLSSGLMLAAAFASGFSERLIRRTVEAIIK
jgi:hypothetical protein